MKMRRQNKIGKIEVRKVVEVVECGWGGFARINSMCNGKLRSGGKCPDVTLCHRK